MDIETLKTFCIVAQYKSFRKAAEVLRITQPGITRRIQSLEEELGHPLLIRTPQFVTLTKQGIEFLPYAERTLQVIEEGTNKIMEGVKEEQLIVGGAPTTCFNLLPEAFKEFNLQHHTRLSIYTATSQQVINMLLDQTIDIGFTTTTVPISLLKYETIYMEEFICVGQPDLVHQYVAEGVITKYPVPIIMSNLTSAKGHPLEPVNKHFIDNPLFEVIAEANYLRVTESLARIGMGFALLPVSDAQDGLNRGELIKISLPNIDLPTRPVNMVTYKNHQMKSSVMQLKKIIKNVLANI